MKPNPYDEWLAERREGRPPAGFVDRVMSRVEAAEPRALDRRWSRLVRRVERSPAACLAVCGSALAVGGLPFAFLLRFVRVIAF